MGWGMAARSQYLHAARRPEVYSNDGDKNLVPGQPLFSGLDSPSPPHECSRGPARRGPFSCRSRRVASRKIQPHLSPSSLPPFKTPSNESRLTQRD